MGKVRLTQEQADAIEGIKEYQRKLLNSGEHRIMEEFKDLRSLTTDEFMDALYIGYEVEPEFKVGDWIIDEFSGSMTIIENAGYANDLNNDSNNIRKATKEEIAKEKQRRWWAKHGRDVWELKTKDVLKFGKRILVVTNVDHNKVYFKEDGWHYLSNLDESWSVICFAEDRKDIDAE